MSPTDTRPDAADALAVHLCVLLPRGHWGAIAALEMAFALREDLRRLGLAPTLARRRLRPDAVNYVFGIEHGFDADAARGHACVLVRGPGEARQLGPPVRRLLARFAVLEADPAAVAAYREGRDGEPPLQLWQPGPSAEAAAAWALPTAERPLGLLVEGEPNERQAAVLAGLERLGLPVQRQPLPLAGPERAQRLRQAAAWLALLPVDDAAPDLLAIRLAQRHGVPVLAEVSHHAAVPDDGAHAAIRWFEPRADDVLRALGGGVGQPGFAAMAAAQGQACLAADRSATVAAVWRLGQQVRAALRADGQSPQAPDRLNLDLAGAGHRPGWFNLGAEPGLGGDATGTLDAIDPLQLPRPAGHWQQIDLGDVVLGDAATGRTLDASLHWLAEGGRVLLRCPARADWRAALAPWGERFWQRGHFAHALQIEHLGTLDADGLPVAAERAVWLRLVLQKAATSAEARSRARVMRADFALPN